MVEPSHTADATYTTDTADATDTADTADANDRSMFQVKYEEFADDVVQALPEYADAIHVAKNYSESERIRRFQEEVKVGNTLSGDIENYSKNPVRILPGVEISEVLWASLSDSSKKAIWEHLRILSICCFMETGYSDTTNIPAWMDDVMKDLKEKMEGVDFQSVIKKFMGFFQPGEKGDEKGDDSLPNMPGMEKLFENGFPKIPERFLKGHMAKLAQEIVKEIKPEDLGFTDDILENAKKNPSKAFEVLFGTLSNRPDVIEKTIKRIGKKLQQKIMLGQIRPMEIAREAEELMKEFADNKEFVDVLSGIKSSFGFEDMETARAAGKEGSARLHIAKERLRKKMEKKKQAQQAKDNKST